MSKKREFTLAEILRQKDAFKKRNSREASRIRIGVEALDELVKNEKLLKGVGSIQDIEGLVVEASGDCWAFEVY